MDFSTGATIVTAIAAAVISYLLQKPLCLVHRSALFRMDKVHGKPYRGMPGTVSGTMPA